MEPGLTEIPPRLREELAEWSKRELTARFFWRDDDAVTDTPALRQLFEVARAHDGAPAIAVIPEWADFSLAALARTERCCIWQHGWNHRWHGRGEFGDGRRLEEMRSDARSGRARMDSLFGSSGWQRVFVPPFHEISVPFKALLPELGYLGISGGIPLTPRIESVNEINALDLIDWETKTPLSLETVCELIVDELSARRSGQTPSERPIGLLTHHLVTDESGWSIFSTILSFLESNPACKVLPANQVFSENAASRTSRPSPGVTVFFTSCQRHDLLEQTIDSFLTFNTYPIHEYIVIEDSTLEVPGRLREKYCARPFRWISRGGRFGKIAAIDLGFTTATTEYVFHCEDDWEFTTAGFIEKSLAILQANPQIVQTWLRALDDTNDIPYSKFVFFAGEIPYRLIQPNYEYGISGRWHGFSFNPALKRRADYELLGSLGSLDRQNQIESWRIERGAGEFYAEHGFLAAIIADNDGKGYLRHIGENRHVAEPAKAHA